MAPTETLTFLFTDIAGVAKLWEHNPKAMHLALAVHDDLVHRIIQEHGGLIFKTLGDSCYAAFNEAGQAIAAAIAAQRALFAQDWGEIGPLRVSMALHSGGAEWRSGDYYGPTVYRTTRILALGHGGQILLSRATRDLASAGLPPEIALRDLGERYLQEILRPEQVFQVAAPDLPAKFPPLKSRETVDRIDIVTRELREVAGWAQLLPYLTERVPQELRIEKAKVLVWDGECFAPHEFEASGHESHLHIPADWPLDDPLVLQDWQPEDDGDWPVGLLDEGYQLAYILVVGGEPVGLFAFGRRLSGEYYDPTTIKALEGLADRVAGAVEHARLLDQTAFQARLNHELALARRIQQSLLPKNELRHGTLEVAALSIPAREVGGDFYSFQQLADGGLTVAIGDVSGKGMGAALLMAVASTILTTIAGDGDPPAVLLGRVHRLIANYTRQNRQNVALCTLRFTPLKHGRYKLHAANAGAVPPFLRRGNGADEWLWVEGLPLGTAFEAPFYQPLMVTLEPGDLVLLCTDGLIEAENEADVMLGFEGVEQAITALPPSADAHSVAKSLLQTLARYSEGRELADDVTLLLVRVAEPLAAPPAV